MSQAVEAPSYIMQRNTDERLSRARRTTNRVELREAVEDLGPDAIIKLQGLLESTKENVVINASKTILDLALGRNNKLVLPPDQYVAVVMDALAQELPIVVAMARTSQNSVDVDARNGYERIAQAVSASLDKLALSSG